MKCSRVSVPRFRKLASINLYSPLGSFTTKKIVKASRFVRLSSCTMHTFLSWSLQSKKKHKVLNTCEHRPCLEISVPTHVFLWVLIKRCLAHLVAEVVGFIHVFGLELS